MAGAGLRRLLEDARCPAPPSPPRRAPPPCREPPPGRACAAPAARAVASTWRQHRATGDGVQHLRDARAHAHALAGGEDDDQQGLVRSCRMSRRQLRVAAARVRPAHHATCVPAAATADPGPEHVGAVPRDPRSDARDSPAFAAPSMFSGPSSKKAMSRGSQSELPTPPGQYTAGDGFIAPSSCETKGRSSTSPQTVHLQQSAPSAPYSCC